MDYFRRATRAWKNLILFFVRDIPASILGAIYTRLKGFVQRAFDIFMLVLVMLIMLVVLILIILALLALILMPQQAWDASLAYTYIAFDWARSLTIGDVWSALDWIKWSASCVYDLGWTGIAVTFRAGASVAKAAFEGALAAAKNKSNDV